VLVTVFKEPVVFRSVQDPWVDYIAFYSITERSEASRAERRNCIAEDFTDCLARNLPPRQFGAASVASVGEHAS